MRVSNLVSEPLVELVGAVEHEAFSLGSFFALSHQSREFVAFEKSGNLEWKQRSIIYAT